MVPGATRGGIAVAPGDGLNGEAKELYKLLRADYWDIKKDIGGLHERINEHLKMSNELHAEFGERMKASETTLAVHDRLIWLAIGSVVVAIVTAVLSLVVI